MVRYTFDEILEAFEDLEYLLSIDSMYLESHNDEKQEITVTQMYAYPCYDDGGSIDSMEMEETELILSYDQLVDYLFDTLCIPSPVSPVSKECFDNLPF